MILHAMPSDQRKNIHLDLSRNKLTAIPEDIFALPFQEVNLEYNCLNELPSGFWQFTGRASLKGNPIYGDENQTIHDILRSIFTEPSNPAPQQPQQEESLENKGLTRLIEEGFPPAPAGEAESRMSVISPQQREEDILGLPALPAHVGAVSRVDLSLVAEERSVSSPVPSSDKGHSTEIAESTLMDRFWGLHQRFLAAIAPAPDAAPVSPVPPAVPDAEEALVREASSPRKKREDMEELARIWFGEPTTTAAASAAAPQAGSSEQGRGEALAGARSSLDVEELFNQFFSTSAAAGEPSQGNPPSQ